MAGKRKQSSAERPNTANHPLAIPETPPAKKRRANFPNGALRCKATNVRTVRKPSQVINLDAEMEVVLKLLKEKGVGFPRFPHGTVYIQLLALHEKYTYTFDRDLLARSSSLFDKTFPGSIIEADKELANEVKKGHELESFFELKYTPELNTWLLVRAPFTKYNDVEVEKPEISAAIKPDASSMQLDACGIRLSPTSKSLDSSQIIAETTSDTASLSAAVFAGVLGSQSVHGNPTAELITFSHSLDNVNAAEITPAPEQPTTGILGCIMAHTENAENADSKKGEDPKVVMEEYEESKPLIKIEEVDELTPNNIQTEIPIESEEISSNNNTTPGVLLKICQPSHGIKKEHDQFASLLKNETGHIEDGVKRESPEVEIATENQQTHKITLTSPVSICEESKTANETQIKSVDGNPKAISIDVTSVTENHKDTSKIDTTSGIPLDICEAHHNLFLLFHNMTPEIDTKNINTALKQIENIIVIAEAYHCIPLVRPHLCHHLFEFGYSLYKAIYEDPPRWLRLSTTLESSLIFKEAIIHTVGRYPSYPWKTVLRAELPPYVRGLIRRKSDHLRLLKNQINEDLFISSIAVNGHILQLANVDKADFGTWLIVQLWRDWFAVELTKRSQAKCTAGPLYRLLAKGGDSYLPYPAVLCRLQDYQEKGLVACNLRDVEEDLKIMKEFAQKRVGEMVVNNSWLDVEKEKIEYFTCTTVENDEFPWVMKAGD